MTTETATVHALRLTAIDASPSAFACGRPLTDGDGLRASSRTDRAPDGVTCEPCRATYPDPRNGYALCPVLLDPELAIFTSPQRTTCDAEVQATVESWQTVNGAYELQDEEGAGIVRLYCREDHALGVYEYDPGAPLTPEAVRALIEAAAGIAPQAETTPRSVPDAEPTRALFEEDAESRAARARHESQGDTPTLITGGPAPHINATDPARPFITPEEALARDLLDLHTRGAISLDRWTAARAFVEARLGPITENHV